MNKTDVRVLLVEDDEDDYVIIRDVMSEIKYLQIELTRVDNYVSALETAKNGLYDVFIIDYLLKGFTGLDLLNEFKSNGFRKPVIILTGQGDHDIDLKAMEEGASDYLEKDRINPALLEKTIRYAISQSEARKALEESEKRLRILSTKLIEAQELERKRIAKELHDSISSNLAAIKFEIQKQMNPSADKTPDAVNLCFKTLSNHLQDTIEETQRIYTNLRPTVLDDLGILMAIQWFCRKFCQVYANIFIDHELKVAEEEIPESIKIVIYRVIQEALNNVAKHSNADSVNIIFEKPQDKIFLTIKDNGCGFDVEAKNARHDYLGGMGLLSMQERVSHSGGHLTIYSDGKNGTQIRAVWPGGGHRR